MIRQKSFVGIDLAVLCKETGRNIARGVFELASTACRQEIQRRFMGPMSFIVSGRGETEGAKLAHLRAPSRG